MPDPNGLILTSINKGRIKGLFFLHIKWGRIDEIDEVNLGGYMRDAGDSFTIYLPEIIIRINNEEHIITSKEFDNLYGYVIQLKDGKIVV